MLDLLALEDDVFQRCLSAQPDPTGSRGPTELSALTSCVNSTLRLPASRTAAAGPDPQVVV